MHMHTPRSCAAGACVRMNLLQLWLRVCCKWENVLLGERDFGVRKGRMLDARIARWWIFWLTVFSSFPAAHHHVPASSSYLPFMLPPQAIGELGPGAKKVDSWKREKRGEREDWQGPGGRLRTPELLLSSHLHRQNDLFLLSVFFYTFSFHLHRLHPFISSDVFVFFPSFSPAIALVSQNKLDFPLFLLTFFFYTIALFILLAYLQIYLLSLSLSCSGLAELCILLICCSAIFWRQRLIFTLFVHFRDLAIPPNHLHSSPPFAPKTVLN